MQQLTALREEITTWEGIALQLNDLHGLAQLLEEEPDEEMQADCTSTFSYRGTYKAVTVCPDAEWRAR